VGLSRVGAAVSSLTWYADVTITATGSTSDLILNASVSSGGNAARDLTLTAGRSITLNNAAGLTTGGAVTLAAQAGSISEAGTGAIAAAALTTSSATGTTLNTGNTVGSFQR